MFETLSNQQTGLDFSNGLTNKKDFNLFKYNYFYNGSGIGAGDFNNDGLIDLFFASNQQKNRMYINLGNFKFKEITNEAKTPEDSSWSTGVSVVDINGDGLLDIYVCRVGNYGPLKSRNELLINQGMDKNGLPVFTDQAQEYGLDFSGFSTQAAFFDYDNDGDLDMFLLNHSVHENGTFLPRKEFMGTHDQLSGDRMYRNDGSRFTDVTKEAGINSTAIGYGLGIAVADIDMDGYPDIYISNDFHENDYLYINQRNGTFKEEGETRMMHTSRYSMGVDIADINNDAYPEIISLDMLPNDAGNLRRSLGEDAFDVFKYKINAGYSYQFSRNNLQYNRRNGMFSETGLYSGVYATDWSWAPLWMDFNNDGLKDLFISTGIPKRMNDIDYINFISNDEIQKKMLEGKMEDRDMAVIDHFPEIKMPNKFYLNTGNLSFTDADNLIDGNEPAFSHGAIYADLDNDGDLDIVVNNMNSPAVVYKNNTSLPGNKNYLKIGLKGPEKNRFALGAKVIVYTKNGTRTYEKFPARGYMSSMEIPILIGLEKTDVDSILLIWPDHTCQHITRNAGVTDINIVYHSGLPFYSTEKSKANEIKPALDVTRETGLDFFCEENNFVDFKNEPLIPRMVSSEGPALAVSDINHDGYQDVFIGASRNKKSAVYIQGIKGKFARSVQPDLEKDSTFEDVGACWVDVNRDRNLDLIVVSGGSEFYSKSEYYTPRVYMNDAKGNLKKLDKAFGNLFVNASCVMAADVNGDGFADLFIGGRSVPGEYGKIPQSYLLINDKTGRFKDETFKYSKELSNVGLVTSATWVDIDKDGDEDLLLSLEWGGIVAFINNKGQFSKKMLSDKNGWWNFVLPCDVDQDGNIDLVCGNLGLNSRLKASNTEPVQMYYNDFDFNGRKEQLLTYYLHGEEIPFMNKAELEKQIPALKMKYLYAADFSRATIQDIFSAERLHSSEKRTANYFANAIMMNKGNLQFETKEMPWEAQLSSYRDAILVNANDDSLPDILLVGNDYNNNVGMGRNDADYATILINKGKGDFETSTLNGVTVKGQVRHIRSIKIGTEQSYVLARNSDSLMVIKFSNLK